ncbi:hypothetical protein M513_11507 [Trichuris suis]|uniref:Elongation factor 1-beta n=2 Tax=Trichuris suis TaxID=68888 RepID=A0A085LRP8_9BILA|nr:hypothetical protein M513_11507 [Trichuris suis]
MVQLKDLKTAAGLSEVNKTLESQSYINGYCPTSVDADFFHQISTPSDAYPHLQRWYRHMESFTEEEKATWEKCTIGERIDAKAAPDDEDIDLFGDSSEEEMDEEKERIKQQRLKAYEMKKANKPAEVAKSNIILDIKPWDDETDLAEMERQIRAISTDGLLWGASKVIPVAYGIKKVQISCVVEDDKVGTDFLEDRITAIEDLKQKKRIPRKNENSVQTESRKQASKHDGSSKQQVKKVDQKKASKHDRRSKQHAKKVEQKYKLVLDVKPADDKTNMTELESIVRQMGLPGLKWGESKVLPVAYTIKKLRIACIVPDKLSVSLLEEMITNEEDVVQSVDVVSFVAI